ncbi:MAG: hypothetical protein ACU84Q_02765 [Gammaproteobacteria bacterium]
MTEFVISATYVLIPLFIAIPMLAKYIDIKQAAVQAARYEAWEYTVWYEDDALDDHDILDNYSSGIAGYLTPEKPLDSVRNESQRRIMSRVGTEPGVDVDPIHVTDATNGWTAATANGLWTSHRGLRLYEGEVEYGAETMTSDDTPTLTIFGIDIGSVMTMLLDLVETAFGFLAEVLDVVDKIGDFLGDKDATGNDPKFSAINTDGYSRVQMTSKVRGLTNRDGELEIANIRDRLSDNALTGATPTQLDFYTKASVLADGWNAGGTEHAYLQVNGGTPSVMVKEMLDLPVLDEVWDVIAFLAPELTECTNDTDPEPPIIMSPFAGPEGNLWFGYVDGDVVHPDRLSVVGEDASERLGSHVCDDSGRCVWDDDVQGLEDAGMSPLSHSPCIP